MKSLDRFQKFFLAPADALKMRFFECAFTATFLLWMARSFVTWREWLTADGFRLTTDELRSVGYPAAFPPLENWQVGGLGLLIAAGGVMVFAGRGRRAGLVLLFLCAVLVQRVDYMASFTLNKLFVSVFAILALAPGPHLDTGLGSLQQSQVALRVLQATLILQYFAAGLAKIEGDWLSGHDLLWGHVQGVYRTDAAAWALRHLPMWAWTAQQHLSLMFELLAPVWFLWGRLKPVAFILGIGFHIIIALMMKDLIFFTVQMLTFYILFIPDGTLRKFYEIFKRDRTQATV